MSQRQVADALGVTQPAVSQQLKFGPDLGEVHPEILLDAASPILKAIAAESGYSRLAVFGSVARHQARADSDIDLIDYGGLKPRIDDDIRREAVPL